MAVVSVRLNLEEEEQVRRNMVLAGEKAASTYMKRLAMEGDRLPDAALSGLRRQVDLVTDQVATLNKLMGQLLAKDGDGLELQVLAGVFLMLYQSVDPALQATIDQHINAKGVQGFLKGGA